MTSFIWMFVRCLKKVWWAIFFASQTQLGFAQYQPDPLRYLSQIIKFEEQDFSSPPPTDAILLVGSSSFLFWNDAKVELSPLTVINRGFGGSVMNDVIYYFDRIIAKYNPRAIVLYEGDNDLAWGLSPSTILSQFDTLIDMIETSLPFARIYVLSVKPSTARAHLWSQAKTVNKGFADRANRDSRINHVDVDTYLVQENGQVREDIFVSDGLHLNAKGYDIWGDVVRAALTVNESLYEEFSMGTNYYTTTSELISDCVTVTNNSAEQRSLFSLSFKLVGPTLVLSDLYPRDQKAENCSDELNVSSDLAGSVVSAEFRTSKLFVRRESSKYQLWTEFSAARNPLLDNYNKFVFDRIEFSIAD